jgi:hypothetical protein
MKELQNQIDAQAQQIQAMVRANNDFFNGPLFVSFCSKNNRPTMSNGVINVL